MQWLCIISLQLDYPSRISSLQRTWPVKVWPVGSIHLSLPDLLCAEIQCHDNAAQLGARDRKGFIADIKYLRARANPLTCQICFEETRRKESGSSQEDFLFAFVFFVWFQGLNLKVWCLLYGLSTPGHFKIFSFLIWEYSCSDAIHVNLYWGHLWRGWHSKTLFILVLFVILLILSKFPIFRPFISS